MHCAPIRAAVFAALAVCILAPLSAAASVPVAPADDSFTARLAADLAAGTIDADEALLQRFRYVFAKDRLPDAYRTAAGRPLKCATPMIAEYRSRRSGMDPAARSEIESYLDPRPAPDAVASTYVSPAGYFELTYLTGGSDAVPSADVDPANGVPDFVERCAGYLDYSWDLEVVQYGFGAPPVGGGRYQISFESMDAYGYTTVVGGSLSRIVLHNDFLGFPANDDPEGDQWGAAKVTCAHEFKHATQLAQSGWSEGGWVEVDATWMEDVAYDQVNDYYNYIPGESPISSPGMSLDGGSTGTGSYEDCIWQHWMSETWGVGFLTDFWNYRSSHTGEAVLDSYDALLQSYGTSLADGFAVFAAWNYATGSRAMAGLGYGEAAGYPTGPVVSTIASYPADRSGSIDHLAADFIGCSGLSGEVGSVSVVFDGQDGATMGLAAVVYRTDGTGVIEIVALDAANDADALLSTPLEEIAAVGLVVVNSAKAGGSAAWSLAVDEAPYVPQPLLAVDAESLSETLPPEGTSQQVLTISNDGEAGSLLDYRIIAMQPLPAAKAYSPASLLGSVLTAVDDTYVPGQSTSFTLKLANASPDEEWIKEVTLAVPAGISITGATDFTGGSYGPLAWDGAVGDGATAVWYGDTGSPNYYGVVTDGQQVYGSVDILVPEMIAVPITLDYTITGDEYGSAPHTVSGTLVITPRDPEIEVTEPAAGEYLGVGEPAKIAWQATRLDTVDVAISRDGGSTWQTLAAGEPNDGELDWTVTGPAAAECLVRVAGADGQHSAEGPGTFTVYAPAAWLSADPDSGRVAQGASATVSVGFDAAGLATGAYPATLLIRPALGADMPLGVTLSVEDAGTAVGVPAAFALAGNVPNPFNPQTAISYRITAAGPMRLEVLDLRGRVVRTLYSGTAEPGDGEAVWDGRDDRGRQVSSGVYLARLISGGEAATVKMTLAR